MAKRGKAKEDKRFNEGFQSGLEFGKSRAFYLLRQIKEGFDDAINDATMWDDMSDGKAKKATAMVQRETAVFITTYFLDIWDDNGEEEKMPDQNSAPNIVPFKEESTDDDT